MASIHEVTSEPKVSGTSRGDSLDDDRRPAPQWRGPDLAASLIQAAGVEPFLQVDGEAFEMLAVSPSACFQPAVSDADFFLRQGGALLRRHVARARALC